MVFQNITISRLITSVLISWNAPSGIAKSRMAASLRRAVEDLLADPEIPPAVRQSVERFETLCIRCEWSFPALEKAIASPDHPGRAVSVSVVR